MTSPFHDFLHDMRAADMPDAVLDLGRRWLLDLLGVAAGGSRTRLSRIVRDHAAAHFGAGTRAAPMLMDGRMVSPAGAALAGGMTIDALDGHDGHKLTKGHVGCGSLPALLALMQAEGRADDRALLAGLVIGYEIGTRAGIALHRTACDYHTSGAWVAVAAASLGARVLRLDGARTREAIGIAEYHGPRSQMMRCIDHPTMVKDGSGWGAMAGVSAAYLAADGFTGAPAITVEGADVADLWADLGTTWRIAEQYFKPWPVCRWAQPSVQAVLDLRARHGVTADQVERIEIATFHQSRRLASRDPASTEEAQYSTAYPAAVALVRGRVDPADVAEHGLADPLIRALACGMTVTEREDFNAAFPARRFADVRLVMKSGQVLESGPTEAAGDPEAPATTDAVRAKFRAYAAPVLGEIRAAELERTVDRLGDGGGTGALFGLLGAT
ncbi:MmgE/PrpD family protein [Paracoccus versutus]|uniref:MmgE/PrpD family protein n=1 Tax=Paracoccus versutus TaxID=34007 RepID=UPI000DF7B60C|nr:MmgE/PrpD family protein [Paracoccus versutus]RDD69467.1 MmgE/PrpD family protein [Paracoccus versutus]